MKKPPKPKASARPDRSWYCDSCRKMTITRIVNDVPVCTKCKTPIERHLPDDPSPRLESQKP